MKYLMLALLLGLLSDGFVSANEEADCADYVAQSHGSQFTSSGKYKLRVGEGKKDVWVYCDMETAGGGWTVFQRRSSGDVDFYRTWKEYEEGFGDIDGDHWLGNTYLHSMTVNKRYVLRIELTNWNNKTCYAEYSNFVVGGAGSMYNLESVGAYRGTCGDSLTFHVGRKFSTFDKDNDERPSHHCAEMYHGAWWYRDCHYSNLNGRYRIGGYHSNEGDGINWTTGVGGYYYSYKKTEMKIRPYKY